MFNPPMIARDGVVQDMETLVDTAVGAREAHMLMTVLEIPSVALQRMSVPHGSTENVGKALEVMRLREIVMLRGSLQET